MIVGIIVAMGKELALLTPHLERAYIKTINGIDFHCGFIGDNTVVAMQCGIGKVNAAIGSVTLINNFNLDLVINTGVAGGADKSINIMDIVIGTRIAYHDVWCGPESPWGEIQGLPLYYKSDKAITDKIPTESNIKRGLICSGDRFIDSIEEIDAIKAKFPEVLAVDMESAAIAQVCTIMKKPFLSLRVISDSPGANKYNTKQYNDFWESAPKQTFKLLLNLLQTI
jgi:adenosylhomocysteine nucleosidase